MEIFDGVRKDLWVGNVDRSSDYRPIVRHAVNPRKSHPSQRQRLSRAGRGRSGDVPSCALVTILVDLLEGTGW